MDFLFTPTEARSTARAVAEFFECEGFKIGVEQAGWTDAPLRTTLLCTKKRAPAVLVEALVDLTNMGPIRELATWCFAQRHHCELYVAVALGARTDAGTLATLRREGIGVLVVDPAGNIHEEVPSRNPALVVTIDPTLVMGRCRAEVHAAVRKFNDVDRKDGLRDLCDIVERETTVLAHRASKKGWLKIPISVIEKDDWNGLINLLERPEVYIPPHHPLLDHTLKTDLHSFKNMRNKIGHPVKKKRELVDIEQQYAERMMQGPRIVAKLLQLQRKVK